MQKNFVHTRTHTHTHSMTSFIKWVLFLFVRISLTDISYCLQLKEYEAKFEAKEIKIRELQNILDSNRENEARLSDVIQSLRDRVRELEDQLGSYHTVSNRGEFTISTLQRELRDANDKVVELEGRLR